MISPNPFWLDESKWDEKLQGLAVRCGRGLEGEALHKFKRHLNEMKHLTTTKQVAEFTLVYGLGNEVDEALMRALKAIRIYIGAER